MSLLGALLIPEVHCSSGLFGLRYTFQIIQKEELQIQIFPHVIYILGLKMETETTVMYQLHFHLQNTCQYLESNIALLWETHELAFLLTPRSSQMSL